MIAKMFKPMSYGFVFYEYNEANTVGVFDGCMPQRIPLKSQRRLNHRMRCVGWKNINVIPIEWRDLGEGDGRIKLLKTLSEPVRDRAWLHREIESAHQSDADGNKYCSSN